MSGPLFKPFRALGYITEDVPFAVQRRGKETYAVVSVGRTWQVIGMGYDRNGSSCCSSCCTPDMHSGFGSQQALLLSLA